ncbi:hypothetical protein HMPREF3190_00279 [Umbribacter vaginalis]|nr:hypothetical protein HMPREF3190_00279 [Coriobacteriales bacterium DNF00809]
MHTSLLSCLRAPTTIRGKFRNVCVIARLLCLILEYYKDEAIM